MGKVQVHINIAVLNNKNIFLLFQNYVQGLQKKVCPPPDDSFTTLHSDLTHLTVLNPSESTATSISQLP